MSSIFPRASRSTPSSYRTGRLPTDPTTDRALRFVVSSTDPASAARRGVLETARGEVETPAFMPVGTLGAVKGLTPDVLEQAGAKILLANLYHLALRPGIEVIEELGGLQAFCGWNGPMLTDSGGFQVFSLAARRAIDEDGVTFRSHLDGARVRWTPQKVVELQERLGVDIAMVLDECPPWPASHEEVRQAVDRTAAWARHSVEARSRDDYRLFGIVQGGVCSDLRSRSAEQLVGLDFDGYAIGGVSVGEPKPERRVVVEHTAPLLPLDKPRYLMGLGTPGDILHAVQQGVDLFDCVLPARNARHGVLFTNGGVLRLKNARFRTDPRPVEEGCPCPCCRHTSRAFLHHLFRLGEITAAVLATSHNTRFYLDFMARLRKAIASGRLADLAASFSANYGTALRQEGDVPDA